MMRFLGGVAVTVLLVGAGTSALRAQNTPLRQTAIGTQLVYQFDVRDPGVGGQLSVPVYRQLSLYPSGAVYLVDSGSLYAVNADVKYRLPSLLYLGGGLNLQRRSVNEARSTDAGVNLLGGFEARRGPIHPFVEGRVILNDGSAFQLAGGLNVGLR
ncbi:MAG: hypothetical protein L0Y54_23490 [Sporichthyaceae bacterium]|nr:hypothetical protein [Sporichthyaceae bacterium]